MGGRTPPWRGGTRVRPPVARTSWSRSWTPQMASDDMRERFIETTTDLLDHDERLVLVLAQIGVASFAPLAERPPTRIINVGLRRQLLISLASGFALTGFRPILHTIASFALQGPYDP